MSVRLSFFIGAAKSSEFKGSSFVINLFIFLYNDNTKESKKLLLF